MMFIETLEVQLGLLIFFGVLGLLHTKRRGPLTFLITLCLLLLSFQ